MQQSIPTRGLRMRLVKQPVQLLLQIQTNFLVETIVAKVVQTLMLVAVINAISRPGYMVQTTLILIL
ncbi:hypothetical protein XALC_1540 [Xanthomonas albilineans GPE PC73]|uniref:Uncharacterized protein n=1 Tax=Xanthomonas albilineans (strain GPE PC73 / CFBP 7063) TaxID=380358 RepID=D2UDQ1_XANAP|nr:hypothetical protein XalbCFBP2523_14815 [Xanthomonas albilineans]CBA16043.1 hypothetical protein XALC_1540 [Xanthomonas albilineans GPE PC73]